MYACVCEGVYVLIDININVSHSNKIVDVQNNRGNNHKSKPTMDRMEGIKGQVSYQ